MPEKFLFYEAISQFKKKKNQDVEATLEICSGFKL